MRLVTSPGGTAYSIFKNFKKSVAGKTGSAQAKVTIKGKVKEIANGWFVGFTPYKNPEVAIAVILEDGATDSYAAKAGKEILQAYYNTNIEETENLKEGDITFIVQFGDKVYDYTNIVAYERKGSASEFCNNVMNDRERLERGHRKGGAHPFSTRAKRIPAYRTRQVHHPQLWPVAEIQGQDAQAFLSARSFLLRQDHRRAEGQCRDCRCSSCTASQLSSDHRMQVGAFDQLRDISEGFY